MTETVPTEKPVLFVAPMVRAILAGRKTVTRRVVSRQVAADLDGFLHESMDIRVAGRGCPYNADRLWVRETWRTAARDGINGAEYAADGAFVPIANTREAADAWVDAHENGKHGSKWRPSIFMRRWACRLVLAVESIRVERLQDISEEDARAEGVTAQPHPLLATTPVGTSAKDEFADLWQSINGKRPGCSWDANPWVWRVAFSRVTP